MATDPAAQPFRPPAQRVSFLLSQLGMYATARFAERLSALELQPSDVGLLRLIATDPGMSQQALATKLGVVPSRVVALVDGLQAKGLVERQRSARDRRNYELHLSVGGRAVMAQMREIGEAHEADLVAALSAEERRTLGELLAKVATSHGIEPDVHPGYRAQS
ncbi:MULTISPECIES: MarR family winged helix-turn-helix transcriptional regulator [Rhodococcus]|uniref:MarR family winged helix-turn-helix transcriptional regulator n=1 Tax=Rhodococcus TaxID=1827 RepID=UPI000BC5B6E9|nr:MULTISPECIES: MarR family transcriptional regulator [Rhodococcus]MBP1161923.1 DNA-binding MarR family transcriptional regulator [Rhodococcus sp. PvR099]MCZ4557685.1 MarR family transcriptional regulator [Rhodococcus maanshanensis]PTR43367.1 DNA-binding MarR family transcriptional regulator [Rhodococcus sp. OK611]SNX91230.1 DNA-binding transcriptional regulator, MarR family [Rhodococcus sp. OK270]